ncbi:MAG TPA: cytochrome c-type biogenesis protein CcmH [Gemmatimonadales bacterium]|nr:cytochrome c-type biogenesis protein CcmH [Gemmatimonadales bacterium]
MSVDRRGFLVVVAATLGAAVQDSLPGSGPVGRIADPASAGRPLDATTAADTDAYYQAIEKQLKCSCGCGLDIYTCRTTDFNCTYSPGLHAQVVALAAEGKTAQQIIDAFIAQYGLQVLMAPPKSGFNLIGYLLPGVVVLVAAGFLLVMLDRWTRVAAAKAAAAAPASGAHGDASPAELERLRRELERFPS